MRVLAALSLEAYGGEQLLNPFGRAGITARQAEADVGRDREVREQRVILENHADAALFRRHAEIRARDRDALDANFSLGNRLEPGDAAQERRLAAAGWAEQAGDAPAFNLEVDPGDDCVRSVALDDAVEFKVG